MCWELNYSLRLNKNFNCHKLIVKNKQILNFNGTRMWKFLLIEMYTIWEALLCELIQMVILVSQANNRTHEPEIWMHDINKMTIILCWKCCEVHNFCFLVFFFSVTLWLYVCVLLVLLVLLHSCFPLNPIQMFCRLSSAI